MTNFNDKFPMLNLWKKFMLGPESRSESVFMSLSKIDDFIEICQNGLRRVIFTNFSDKFPMLNLWRKFMLGPESRSEPAFMSVGKIDDFIKN